MAKNNRASRFGALENDNAIINQSFSLFLISGHSIVFFFFFSMFYVYIQMTPYFYVYNNIIIAIIRLIHNIIWYLIRNLIIMAKPQITMTKTNKMKTPIHLELTSAKIKKRTSRNITTIYKSFLFKFFWLTAHSVGCEIFFNLNKSKEWKPNLVEIRFISIEWIFGQGWIADRNLFELTTIHSKQNSFDWNNEEQFIVLI